MPIRVVLVDDAADLRFVVRTALQLRGGFEVVGEAERGAEAIRMVADLDPDVVVLDLGLPDIAGEQVLSRIRAESPRPKVVIFSGRQAEDRTAYAGQVAGFVVKDADLGVLIDVLTEVGREDRRRVELALAPEPESAGVAREFVRRALRDWDVSDAVDNALIVVSELVTNAMTHTATTAHLSLALTSHTIRIEVRDSGAGMPDLQPYSTTLDHGRGMRIAAALAAAWGVEPDGDGKLIWAEISREPTDVPIALLDSAGPATTATEADPPMEPIGG